MTSRVAKISYRLSRRVRTHGLIVTLTAFIFSLTLAAQTPPDAPMPAPKQPAITKPPTPKPPAPEPTDSDYPRIWRYDLKSGDHLVYRYSFDRHSDGENHKERMHVEARFRSHVIVTAENSGRISLGFERIRESANLTEFVTKGRDRLDHELPDFQKRMAARPSHFSEAMEISAAGAPLFGWDMARETSSHLIASVHEILPLPPTRASKGKSWQGDPMLSLENHWMGDETIHDHICHHVEGVSPGGAVKLSYWWSPDTGVIEQVLLDGTYPSSGGSMHEILRMELESRTRGESLDSWLVSPATQQAALQSLLLTQQIPVTAAQLSSAFLSNDPASQSLALAVATQRKLAIPAGTLLALDASSSDLIQSELKILKASQSGEASSSNTAQQLDDCHRPLPAKSSIPKFGTSLELAPGPPAAPAPAAVPDPDSLSEAIPDNKPKDNPDVPYLLRIPPTYRPDHPHPLLVYLSGGAGFAIDALNTGQDVLSLTDYIVLYPQAAGLWWNADITHRFNAVFNDVLRRYNIDRDRVYITGFSNGGTGALYYATLWPQRFAAIVTLMGAGICNDQVQAGIGNVRDIPIFLVHGENDTTIPSECSSNTLTSLNDHHPETPAELRILPKLGHEITLSSDEHLALNFFKDKTRNPFPKIVDYKVTDPTAIRAYWVEILEDTPKSDLDVRVKSENLIDIHSHEIKSLRLYLHPEFLTKPGDLHIAWNGKQVFSGALRDTCTLPAPPADSDLKLDLADPRDVTLPQGRSE